MSRKDTINSLVEAFGPPKEELHSYPRNNLYRIVETCNKRFKGEFVRWEYDDEAQTRVRVYEKRGSFIVLKLDDI